MNVAHVEPAEHLRTLAGSDPKALDGYLATLSGPDVVRAMFRLSDEERHAVLVALDPEVAADFIEDVPDAAAADLIEALPSSEAASIVAALPGRDQADLLAEFEAEDRGRILSAMPAAAAAEARTLLDYDPDTAGGLMAREHLSFSPDATARTVLTVITGGGLSLSGHLLEFAYVVDAGRLVGLVRTSDLVSAPPTLRLKWLMHMPTVVNASADLAMVDACLQEAETLSLPVTDDDGNMLGVLHRKHVDDVRLERANEEHLKSQGIVGGEELRSMPTLHRARRRLSWLSVNIGLNLISVSVIAAFEATLEAVIALAIFLPIVSDMSGCSGNQAVAVSMRELTLGVIGARDALRVWWQELKVGLLAGIALGVLLGISAWLWKGSVGIALVVGFALAVNTLVAVSIGGTVPVILKRLGVDPAVASGPVLTTLTDMCGFLLVLGTATALLPWL